MVQRVERTAKERLWSMEITRSEMEQHKVKSQQTEVRTQEEIATGPSFSRANHCVFCQASRSPSAQATQAPACQAPGTAECLHNVNCGK